MRVLGSLLKSAISLKNPTMFFMLELDMSEKYYFTSLSYSVRFNNNLYIPDGGLTGFGPPRSSTTVDREIYEVTFLDHADELQAEIRAGINGAPLTVYTSFLNSKKKPLLSRSDVFIAYSGFIDTAVIINNSETKMAKIQAASPLAALDLVSAYSVSRDGMDQMNSLDTSFDDIYQGSKSVTLKWGKS